MKPAWRRTEFWFTMAAMLFGFLLAGGYFTEAAGCQWSWCQPVQWIVSAIVMILGKLGYDYATTKKTVAHMNNEPFRNGNGAKKNEPPSASA